MSKHSGPLLLVGLLAALLVACGPPPISTATEMPTAVSVPGPTVQSSTTTILLVRHAERLDDTMGTPLSETGKSRAQTLVHVAGSAGITAIFASEFICTQETVQPLADFLGLPVNQVNAEDVKGLAEQVLSQHAGGVVLIAGHGNTVPEIIAGLGGDVYPALSSAGADYDDLFVITHRATSGQPGAEVSVVKLRYGPRSP